MARKNRKRQRLKVVNPDCAGIDIGKDRHFVAVDPARSSEPVRAFDGFTRDLQAMAEWLSSCGVKTVAMESTSVYWIPVYEVLERAGFEVLLVPPRMTKQIAGRKSDVLDLPVDLAVAVLRAAAGRLPSRRCGLPATLLRAPDEAPDRRPLALRAAHAEGADRDECPAGLGDRRHHGADRE